MFLTSSLMTRVLPVPHAISIILAPLAQAFKQSVWQGLKTGSPFRDSSDSALFLCFLCSLAGSNGFTTFCVSVPRNYKEEDISIYRRPYDGIHTYRTSCPHHAFSNCPSGLAGVEHETCPATLSPSLAISSRW